MRITFPVSVGAARVAPYTNLGTQRLGFRPQQLNSDRMYRTSRYDRKIYIERFTLFLNCHVGHSNTLELVHTVLLK